MRRAANRGRETRTIGAQDETWRMFAAIALPEAIVDIVAETADILRQAQLPLRIVQLQQSHLTVQFFGDVPVEQAELLGIAMQHEVFDLDHFVLRLDGLGGFPNLRQPRVVWLGIGGDLDELTTLHARVVRAAASVGLSLEAERFRPHVTLSRTTQPLSRAEQERLEHALSDVRAALSRSASRCAFTVEDLTLFRSHLDRTGARHEVIRRFPLQLRRR